MDYPPVKKRPRVYFENENGWQRQIKQLQINSQLVNASLGFINCPYGTGKLSENKNITSKCLRKHANFLKQNLVSQIVLVQQVR